MGGNLVPISQLERLDGDTSIMFIAGKRVVFSEPSTDLWYDVTTPSPDIEL
jgi:hypothetical protein